jgi:beta-phosphoglucomutase
MDSYGVIFDMDGVLVDSYRAHYQSWRETAEIHGLNISKQDFARLFGRTAREFIEQLWPGRFDDAGIARFYATKEHAYRDVLRVDFPEMDGAGELIESLHRAGFKLAIGSSGPPENVAMVKGRLPHGELITEAVDGSQVERGKPDPQVFLLAARKLRLEPAYCAVIEDSLVGIEAARGAGMVAIALVGTATCEALSPRAHLVVDSLRQLTPELIADAIRNV